VQRQRARLGEELSAGEELIRAAEDADTLLELGNEG
jgi:hypothetical protein